MYYDIMYGGANACDELYINTLMQSLQHFIKIKNLSMKVSSIAHKPNSSMFYATIDTEKDYCDILNDEFQDFFHQNNCENWDKPITYAYFEPVLGNISGAFDLKDIIQSVEKAKLKNIKKPEDVIYILQRLNDAGYSAYVVGGCVRDASMMRTPHDWDITTSATPDQVEKVFEDHKIIETGLKHGTVTVMRNGEGYEITTYRIDGDYSDGRHPDKVSFTGDVVEDLKRRDFTMNAIALDNNGDVVDPFDGCADIYSRTVRAVGSPEDRFNEDALRIMRAIRFAAVFDFEVDGETKAAIFKLYPKLEAVSKERINAELLKIANSNHFFSSLAEYAEVFAFIMGIDSFNIKQSLDSEDYITKLAYMFVSVSDAEQVMNDLKFDGDTRDKVIELVKWKPYHLSQIDRVELKIWLNRIGAEQLYRLGKIKGYDLTSAINNLKEECYTIKDLAVNGNDIMALGYKGKDVGTVLTETLKAVIEETIPNDKTEIIKFIQGLNIQ